MIEHDDQQMRAFLRAHHILTLATIGDRGEPQAADLYYALLNDLPLRGGPLSAQWPVVEARLCFISAESSRHVANIGHNARIACTIHVVSSGWRDIRGVQIEGTCARITGPEQAQAWACYVARFPFVLTDPSLTAALGKVHIYRIIPGWLRWIDNAVSLGYKVEYRP
jgi:uncharacterized protein YhbP (UPF0306 family)